MNKNRFAPELLALFPIIDEENQTRIFNTELEDACASSAGEGMEAWMGHPAIPGEDYWGFTLSEKIAYQLSFISPMPTKWQRDNPEKDAEFFKIRVDRILRQVEKIIADFEKK